MPIFVLVRFFDLDFLLFGILRSPNLMIVHDYVSISRLVRTIFVCRLYFYFFVDGKNYVSF